MRLRKLIVAGGVAMFMASAASAATVTQNFTVAVTSNFDPDTGLPGSLYVGSTGTGSVTFETDDPFEFIFATALSLTMDFAGFVQSFTEADDVFGSPLVGLDSTGMKAVDIFFTVVDDDSFTPGFEDNIDAPGIVDFSFSAPVLSGNGMLFGMESEVQTVSVAAIPVPASLPLLVGGIFLFGAIKRTSRKT